MSSETRGAHPNRFLIGLIVVSTLGLLSGYEVLLWSVRSKTAQLREELLTEATAITRQINLVRIRALSFTAADLKSAEYQRLTAQWQAYARITRFSALYGVARRNGVFVVGPGNRRGASAALVPPGTVYENPPAWLVEVFDTRQPQVNGPYEEAGKKLVSAWIPVLDPRSEDVLMVMVMSVDAGVWNAQFVRLWWGTVCFALPLVLSIVLAVLLVRRNSRIPLRWLAPLEVCVTVLLGVIFTVTFWRMTRDLERRTRLTNFQVVARAQVREVSEQLTSLRTRIGALTLVLGGESEVNRENFMRYASSASQLSFAETWAWVPLVPAAQLKPFEARVRQMAQCDFFFWQKNGSDERRAVSTRDVYFPVLYSEPTESEHPLAGFDCGSDPDLREALETSIRTGMITGTTPELALRKKGDQPKLYVFEPVYVSGIFPRKLSGVVLVVLDWEKVLRHAFMPLISPTSSYVSADICQLGTEYQPNVIVTTSPVWWEPVATWFLRADDHRLHATMPLFFFGEAYALAVRAEPKYYAAHALRLGLATVWVGGLLTLLMANVAGHLANRRVLLERQVRARSIELGRANQQIGTILDTAGDGILALDAEGRLTGVNAAAAQMLGYEICELIGQPCEVLWRQGPSPGTPETEEASPLCATYKYGSAQRPSDEVFLRKDGTRFHVAYVSKPLRENGNVVGAVVTFRDITEQRQAEEDLQRANTELENVNNALREASQAKNRFLAHMSHEIRTPLHSVIGMSGLLMSTALTEEQMEYAETIRVSGESLLSVVNEILDFSKIEAEKLELENRPFNLRHCVEDAVDVVAAEAARKNLELLYHIDEKLPAEWIGDVSRLRQILVNLLSNAIKFTDKGEVEVAVTGQPRDDRQTLLWFSVRDTGVGISSENKSKLFASFSQCDASTTRRFGGTGLGLTISKRLCELMGGSMEVESPGVPGYGTTFRFSVLAEADRDERAPNTASDIVVVGKRVLIVAGSQAGQDVLAQQIRALGMIPVAVGTAREALDLLSAADLFGKFEAFDLAMLDAQLSDMDGAALGQAIHAIPGREKLGLILLSPLGAHAVDAATALMAEQLTKPVKMSHLYDAIVRLFAAQPAQRQAAARAPARFNSEVGRQHPLRILVAEDNVVNQKVAVCILEKLGYRADTVSNGLEAVEAVRRGAYDLVLMDGQMPEMDGEQAAIQIRKELPAARQPWIVAMTANVMTDDRERYQAAGMNDYISKPVRVERLVEVLLSVQAVAGRTGLAALGVRDAVACPPAAQAKG